MGLESNSTGVVWWKTVRCSNQLQSNRGLICCERLRLWVQIHHKIDQYIETTMNIKLRSDCNCPLILKRPKNKGLRLSDCFEYELWEIQCKTNDRETFVLDQRNFIPHYPKEPCDELLRSLEARNANSSANSADCYTTIGHLNVKIATTKVKV